MSGIFGVSSRSNCMADLFYGTDYHSHLGSQYGGIAIMDNRNVIRKIHSIAQSQFKSKFYEDYIKIEGKKGIGVISSFCEQPIFLNSKFGPFCIVTSGYINNMEELFQELKSKGISFSEMTEGQINSTELVAKLINQGKDIVEGIESMFDRIDGSCSLILMNKDGLYAARDRSGYLPLAIGSKEGAWAAATESSSFPNTGFKINKFLGPGEILLMTEKGLEVKQKKDNYMKICAFLWIYTGFPASCYEGINVETVRERSGRALAMRDKDIDVDVVSGVPDSGTAHAIGYAIEAKKPFRRPLIKYTPGYGRSYIPPSQEVRDHIAKMKLIAIKEIISGNRITVCDDSIVRGTQMKNFTIKKLWEAGATEIHVRPACPPLMFPCKYTQSTRTIYELAARRAIRDIEGSDIDDVSEYLKFGSDKYNRMIEWIAKDLEVTTLRYQTVDDMVDAIGLPKEKLCLHCWIGECSGCHNERVNEKETAEV